ncbi:hypothetical protein [Anaeromyxobacter sp. SG26]|uniref:hypothetical protein n=1 Tax=Anaeromyxobacter sp. SG26 TaxID=2925407 RepID=UPI001F57DFA9|nr:hypothetical protein [Anaeromyxobacter sp. SG26]
MAKKTKPLGSETCALCGCTLNRSGKYATEDAAGRSHATEHHFVAERFFGRSSSRRGTRRTPVFATCPWNLEGKSDVYCYECHELVLHNPVLLPEDVSAFAALVRERGFGEAEKGESREKLAGRVKLFHDVIAAGLKALSGESGGGSGYRLQRPASTQE